MSEMDIFLLGCFTLHKYIVDNSRHILRGKLLNSKDDTYYRQLENGSELWTCRNNVFFTLEDPFFAKQRLFNSKWTLGYKKMSDIYVIIEISQGLLQEAILPYSL